MLTIRRKISVLFVAVIIFIGGFLYLYNQIYLATGKTTTQQTILVQKGDNALVVGEKLTKAGVISGKYYLAYYLWKGGQIHSLVAGVYEFAPGVKIPEVARVVTGGQVASTRVPITFPEGWTMKQMAERLSNNNFSGDEFLAMAKEPSQELKNKYTFLTEIPQGKSLEGYLFPDTYYFAKDATTQDILEKMLKNFNIKMTDALLDEISKQKKTLYDVITMASIIEGEVQTDEDRKIVSGLFWNRLKIGQAFGSDATLEYVLGGNKRQHSLAETKTDSPYNTYLYKGLPPGPVSNPGISAIRAAIYPIETEYNYFLSDPKTGKTIFSKTFEEHVVNKGKYGL
ncbi:MAG: Aminodeoxychorismate lyase [Candidatus Moranbacteria bacterium GW2011_GWD2_36_12]|nr:MAG: Aminodeoxychorismate lyase [Candidatus Moranbacteria bacterium GW2011_GWD2_36_12]KKQ06687.1 MAG: Aminodeoxychorismate lyase [Candidatus Moranbacteria bacterium GW2011_GWE2_36_40]